MNPEETIVEIDYNGELSESELVEVIAFALQEYFARYGCVPIDPETKQPRQNKPTLNYENWFAAHDKSVADTWLNRHREINNSPQPPLASWLDRHQEINRPEQHFED